MEFRVIVACDDAWGIGKAGAIPWRVPEDMARFKALTTGDGRNAAIMGRNTWNSLPEKFRPLPWRRNMVLTRAASPEISGALMGTPLCGSLDAALVLCDTMGIEDAWVIGGAEVYREALQHPACVGVEVTRVPGTFECDVFFPSAFLAAFDMVMLERHYGYYEFQTWRKR